MKVLITGATGLIGQEIIKLLQDNQITVHYLSTKKNKLKTETLLKGFFWDINQKIIDKKAFEGVTHLIHLAGASISKRWTKTYKNEIIESRILSTNLLLDFLQNNPHSIQHITTASAIGIYKSDENQEYTEENKTYNNSFLSNVVQKWEDATQQFSLITPNVCTIRIGLVMAKNGGMLPEIITPIKLGLGAIMGKGNQWQSWIHINDLARIFVFTLNKNLSGIFNGVAPNPITHQKMTIILAKTLKKPLFLPNVPQFMMRIILGEMHQLLFESQKVSASKIINHGFEFQFSNFEQTAKDLI